jgi:REP element-mobilizing transposase RayT
VQIYLHLVFSTKHREPFLADRDFRERMFAYLAGTCNDLKSPCLRVGGYVDHVHILCRMGKEIEISVLIREIKRESSKWAKEQSPDLVNFYWQSGYGAFSVSPSHVNPLIRYIDTQEEHHQKESFQDEYRRLLRKYGIEYDERYVWD